MITNDINLALQQLEQGGIAAIPTETVYGLAANAENAAAIQKIYAIKNRPLTHPLIMHIAEGADLTQWVSAIPDYAQQLMNQFWPGPLTLVFPCRPGQVNPLVTGGQDTVAIRCPNHPVAQALLKKTGFPLVAPSANPFGKISPTTAEHVQDSFPDAELLILDGGRCQAGIESTIVDATHPKSYKILRHGTLSEEAICAALALHASTAQSSLRVPGKLDSHYQPEKTLHCFESHAALMDFFKSRQDQFFVLAFSKPDGISDNYFYQLPEKPEQLAYELYYQLRRADQSQASSILIELPTDATQWKGVRERMVKAGFKDCLT